jgi:hypothetical protein
MKRHHVAASEQFQELPVSIETVEGEFTREQLVALAVGDQDEFRRA